MQPIRNAAPVSPEVLDRARRMAWIMHRKGKDCVPLAYLGSGCFSHVFDLGAGLVLKVGGPGGYGRKSARRQSEGSLAFRDDATEQPQADAWPDFVRWTASMKRRPPWAPRVHHLETLSGRVYFAVCERLENNAGRSLIRAAVPRLIVHHAARHRNFRADLHSGNFMRRPGWPGAIVINDPWCPHSEWS